MKENKILSKQALYEIILRDHEGCDELEKQFSFSIDELIYCGILRFPENNKNSDEVLEIACETWSHI